MEQERDRLITEFRDKFVRNSYGIGKVSEKEKLSGNEYLQHIAKELPEFFKEVFNTAVELVRREEVAPFREALNFISELECYPDSQAGWAKRTAKDALDKAEARK